MILIDLVFGILLLLMGRSLFWLCVGVVGFLVGVQCAASLGYSSDGMALLIAIGLGCLGVLLAVCFEWFMIVFGVGFLGGGYLLMNLFPSSTPQDSYSWLIFVVGGIAGMCLMVIIFDWTLIIISSLLGASLVVNALHGTEGFHEILFIGAVVTGILVQYLTLRDPPDQERSARGV